PSRAPVAKDKLADARMPASEPAGIDAIDDAAAGQHVERTAGDGVLKTGDSARNRRPRTAIERAVAHLRPPETALGDVLLASQECVAGAIGDERHARVAGPTGYDQRLRRSRAHAR